MGELRKANKQLTALQRKSRMELGSVITTGFDVAANTVNVATDLTTNAVTNLAGVKSKKDATKELAKRKLSRRKLLRKYGVPKPIHEKIQRVVRAGAGVHRMYPVCRPRPRPRPQPLHVHPALVCTHLSHHLCSLSHHLCSSNAIQCHPMPSNFRSARSFFGS
jgi:hypothetical protein